MTVRWLTALLVLGFAGAEPLSACGDKFLIGSRGTRFQRPAARRAPARILIFLNPLSELPAAFATVPVEAALSSAGFQPTLVTTAMAFEQALDGGGWDLVVVGSADREALLGRMQSPGAPALLPVKARMKSQALVHAIDQSLASRRRELRNAGG